MNATNNPTYIIQISQTVFSDWERRCLISDICETGHVNVLKENQKTATLEIDAVALTGFINDLERQIFTIENNGETGYAGMKRAFNTALKKLITFSEV